MVRARGMGRDKRGAGACQTELAPAEAGKYWEIRQKISYGIIIPLHVLRAFVVSDHEDAKDTKSHWGRISGLLSGNLAIVASSTFRCWATMAGGVWVSQSERETSAK